VALPTLAAPAAVSAADRSAALLALAVLGLLGAQAVRLARQPALAPRALGGSARRSRPEPAAAAQLVVPGRGVGRFRTPTTLVAASQPSRGVGRFRAARVRPPVRI
jgi:hypothetical protein